MNQNPEIPNNKKTKKTGDQLKLKLKKSIGIIDLKKSVNIECIICNIVILTIILIKSSARFSGLFPQGLLTGKIQWTENLLCGS